MQNTNQADRGKSDPVNHPAREEWMSYLYDELPQPAKAALGAHLKTCATCREHVAGWQDAMQTLDAWALPKTVRPLKIVQPVLKWGIAALFVLGFGYGLGRFSAPASENELRAQLREGFKAEIQTMIAASEKPWSNDLRKQIYTEMDALTDKTLAASGLQAERLLGAYDERRQDENRTILAQLKNLEFRLGRQAAEHISLRQEVETVALLTEDGFRRAQQQMYRLTSFAEPDGRFSESPTIKQNP